MLAWRAPSPTTVLNETLLAPRPIVSELMDASPANVALPSLLILLVWTEEPCVYPAHKAETPLPRLIWINPELLNWIPSAVPLLASPPTSTLAANVALPFAFNAISALAAVVPPINTLPELSIRRRSVAAVRNCIESSEWSYLSIPRYSASPLVPSEKKICERLDVPPRIVIPAWPLFSTTKSSAVPLLPALVVPTNSLPELSIRRRSLPDEDVLKNSASPSAPICAWPALSLNVISDWVSPDSKSATVLNVACFTCKGDVGVTPIPTLPELSIASRWAPLVLMATWSAPGE